MRASRVAESGRASGEVKNIDVKRGGWRVAGDEQKSRAELRGSLGVSRESPLRRCCKTTHHQTRGKNDERKDGEHDERNLPGLNEANDEAHHAEADGEEEHIRWPI